MALDGVSHRLPAYRRQYHASPPATIAGPSTIGSSHAWSVTANCTGPPVASKARPSADKRCAHKRVGSRPSMPSLLNNRYAEPSAGSTNTAGSIEPPRSIWHTNGCGVGSTYGPSGDPEEDEDTARPTHCNPLVRCWAVKNSTQRPSRSNTAGAHVEPRAAHDGRFGSASGRRVQERMSNDRITCTLPPVPLVANAYQNAPDRTTTGSGKSSGYSGSGSGSEAM